MEALPDCGNCESRLGQTQMVGVGRNGTPDDLTRSNVSSALPCQALTSAWWTGQVGKNIQCSGCRGLEYLMAGEAAARRGGRAGAPQEGVLLPPDPLTSTQGAQCGVDGNPEDQRLGWAPWPSPARLRDWKCRRPSHVSAARAVISGGLSWGLGSVPAGRHVRVPSPPLAEGVCTVASGSELPRGCVCALVQPLGWGVMGCGLGRCSWSPQCDTDHRRITMFKAWGTLSLSARRLTLLARNTVKQVCLTQG